MGASYPRASPRIQLTPRHWSLSKSLASLVTVGESHLGARLPSRWTRLSRACRPLARSLERQRRTTEWNYGEDLIDAGHACFCTRLPGDRAQFSSVLRNWNSPRLNEAAPKTHRQVCQPYPVRDYPVSGTQIFGTATRKKGPVSRRNSFLSCKELTYSSDATDP